MFSFLHNLQILPFVCGNCKILLKLQTFCAGFSRHTYSSHFILEEFDHLYITKVGWKAIAVFLGFSKKKHVFVFSRLFDILQKVVAAARLSLTRSVQLVPSQAEMPRGFFLSWVRHHPRSFLHACRGLFEFFFFWKTRFFLVFFLLQRPLHFFFSIFLSSFFLHFFRITTQEI